MTSQTGHTFEGLGLNPQLSERLADAGIAAPTPVQIQSIPAILEGKDGVLVSPTGTGKTLAYLLPILQRLDGSKRETQAIVLAPTQELAMQIVREAENYGAALGIKTVALIGGAALSRQLERMKAKPALVVGTPGRVREVASLRKLTLPAVKHIVVDETDRVFSLGGRDDVEKLIKQCSKERQTVFVSATRSDAMKEAEKLWLNQPWESEHAVQGPEAGSGLPDTISHWYFVCEKREKIDLVRRLMRNTKVRPVLLFLNDIERIAELSAKLKYEGFMVDALYGDTSGKERGEALRRFRGGRTALLIATDLAARGLDVPGLPLVIQFEPALDADHYVHRAGRTGRMGKEGISITLVSPQERFIIDKLSKQLKLDMAQKTLYEGRIVSPEEAESGRRKFNTRQEAEVTKAPAESPRKPASPSQPAKPRAAKSAPPAPSAKAKSKENRERDRKNKGAPRWLKEKRESSPGTDRP
ncbi:DEAD/DEAH box helicase [Cohnella candidum]|uniref:RNA helicase n=1 Tax=Cohnella candidum TaxID=2674991 RepID=A0A3G3JT91_9BACL|nr:DEAD/DEAH box helicase [Cohnella candidum]AYQ71422.1 DEAD/DEAH box helicase [Cohnella candidum]